MKKRCLIVGMTLLFALVANQMGETEEQILERRLTIAGQEYIPGEIIVKFKPGVREDVISNLNSRHGTQDFYLSRLAGFKRLRILRRKTVSEMVELYRKDPHVEYAEPNYIAHALWAPNDEYYHRQWHLDNPVYGGINTEQAWEISTGSGVIIAIADTGIAYEDNGRRYKQAPDLADTAFVPGYDFVNGDTHPNDDNGHGTHIAGTIAQSTNNTIGVAGVAFEASLMPIKVLNSSGSGSYADVAEGIRWAADHGAQVINLSLGGSNPSTTLEEAVAYAYTNGVTVVAAAGNDGQDVLNYPAAYDDYVIAVGATRYDETLAYYSNYGPSLDLVAPGGDLNVDQNGDSYGDGVLQQTFQSTGWRTNWAYYFMSGTSCAAPHVSGVAALLIANGIATAPDEVREALQSTAEDHGPAGWDPEYGYGIVDACAALNYSAVPNYPPVADANGPYTGTEDITVTFDGSGSCDPDDDPLTYSWNFGDGSSGSGVNPTHIYSAGGTYTVTLMVNDSKVNSAPATTTATIAEVNDSPVANAGLDQSALVEETLTFNGSASYDPDGSIASYDWNFGDGDSASGISVTHAYSSAGTYTVTLTVTDNGGLTATDTCTATINAAPQKEEFTFSGTVQKKGENRHLVNIKSPGAKSMYVRLTWNGGGDLRLRIYNPEGVLVSQVDKSSSRNTVEEVTIENLGPGDWQVAAKSDSRWGSISYTVEGVINY